jgi:hypothetical protein
MQSTTTTTVTSLFFSSLFFSSHSSQTPKRYSKNLPTAKSSRNQTPKNALR